MPIDLHTLADECEAQTARVQRLRASLEGFPGVIDSLHEVEALASIIDAFVSEVRTGMHAQKAVALEQARTTARMLSERLDRTEERLARMLGPLGWMLPFTPDRKRTASDG